MPSAAIYTIYEEAGGGGGGVERPTKKRDFKSNFPKKSIKTPFLSCYFKNLAVWSARKINIAHPLLAKTLD